MHDPRQSADREHGDEAAGKVEWGPEPEEAAHKVASQSKTFIPVGMAMIIDVSPNAESAIGPIPTANMWWPHTPKPKKPMRHVAYAIET
jgi:hypothetical protein